MEAREEAAAKAGGLLAGARMAALGTLGASGHPLVSLVAVATLATGSPLLLLSRLALHTKNLAADPRASLLLRDEGASDPMAEARVTLIGAMTPVADPSARPRFLARHPEASLYVDFTDFGFYALAVESAHLVAGFGRIVDLTGAEILAAMR